MKLIPSFSCWQINWRLQSECEMQRGIQCWARQDGDTRRPSLLYRPLRRASFEGQPASLSVIRAGSRPLFFGFDSLPIFLTLITKKHESIQQQSHYSGIFIFRVAEDGVWVSVFIAIFFVFSPILPDATLAISFFLVLKFEEHNVSVTFSLENCTGW